MCIRDRLYARRDAAFSDVDSKLSAIGLRRLTMDSLAPDEQKYIKRYFKDIIAPVDVYKRQVNDRIRFFPVYRKGHCHVIAVGICKYQHFHVVPSLCAAAHIAVFYTEYPAM